MGHRDEGSARNGAKRAQDGAGYRWGGNEGGIVLDALMSCRLSSAAREGRRKFSRSVTSATSELTPGMEVHDVELNAGSRCQSVRKSLMH